ncbi:MAG: aminotransferase class V-fold PLP-dependent enzyme [SAR202 cluster bacterium]|nr:aminotransferase class V-fold PLP-dependent enzyme [SAR202 cluster bacterium]
MTQYREDPRDVYRTVGVRPGIHAGGTTTLFGGTKLRPEASDAMAKAASVMVDLDELNAAASTILAKVTGSEAALVTSGSSGGLVLQAAACMAGHDPAKMAQLPNASGLKSQFVIQTCHRFPYDQLYTATGGKLVNVGDGRGAKPWQVQAAINEHTAALIYLVSPFTSRRALPLDQMANIAHSNHIPLIVDAASMLPPRANLSKYIPMGADLVQYSGGKGIRGPQGTGILCGRTDLIRAATANASPNQFIGRGMKVAKEEIVGLLKATEVFLDQDEEEENRQYRQMCERVQDALIEIPGTEIRIEHDNYDFLIPTTIIGFTEHWQGPSRDEILYLMLKGETPIYMYQLSALDEIGVDPTNLSEEELGKVISKLRSILLTKND